jgi:hypothetical protein
MNAMNSFDRTHAMPSEYRPILRPQKNEQLETAPAEPECCCPEMCQLDHGN